MSKRPFAIAGFVVLAVVAIAGIGGFLYYQSLKRTPQYSLALLVDAAKRDDKTEIESLIDINAVVDDFMPQVTDKAVELYGRGLPPQVIDRVATAGYDRCCRRKRHGESGIAASHPRADRKVWVRAVLCDGDGCRQVSRYRSNGRDGGREKQDPGPSA